MTRGKPQACDKLSAPPMRRLFPITALVSMLACAGTAEYPAPDVRSVDQLVRAVGQAAPGSVVEVAAGEYRLSGLHVLRARGTERQPVVVRASQTGSVRFIGNGALRIQDSDWLVVSGFVLAHAAHTLDVVNSNNVRLTRLRLAYSRSKALERGRYVPWIRFHGGVGHRVDHSELGPHPGGLGVTLLFENATRGSRIDHNFFHDRPRDGRNGAETIRLGTGGGAQLDATIEQNLFLNCDGEGEIVSIKSNGIVIRDNTFRNNRGQLVVRAGDDVVIERNQFIADQPGKAVGGVRVHGSDVRVINNYFQDLPLAAIVSGEGTNDYRQPLGVVFSGNLVVDSAVPAKSTASLRSQPIIQLRLPNQVSAPGKRLPPARWSIEDNLLVTDRPLIDEAAPSDFQWRNNVQWNAIPGAALVPLHGVWRASGNGGPGGALLPAPLAASDVGPISNPGR